MKICMLGHKRIPSREGGIEIVVEELSTRMAQKGHKVTCYNRRGHHVSGKKFDTELLKNYKNVELKSVCTIEKKGLAAMSSSMFATFKAAFGNYDIVHFHAEGTCAMLWLTKLFGKKCIVTIHGIDWQREKWRGSFASKYIKFGEKIAAKYADEIIVLSKSIQNYFKETYNRETKFIPNGVNRPEIKLPNLIKKKFSLNKNNYILFLGRIVPEKGLRYLIDAYQNVETNKKLVIAGGSSDTDDFVKELQQKSLKDKRILFTGFVDGDLLEELYSNAYIYVLPSDLEGMPLSLLEAMSYGNCCLVSDIPECKDVVQDVGETFEKSNINDLAQKIQYLLNNPKIVEKYKKNVQLYVLDHYNWDDITDRTLDLYEMIIRE
ncbi:glycosyltransferase family 4 protein [Massilimicrobiota timonensis]|uniref:Glycosyltransferase family 4 protein n=1 Tax=Massilimicrobiota timonensis TaxID=1776392 RepID=A0ABT7UMG6_9FIRM|nr:glycosyltransferase family 4 protein [Massilimicrobiota timonensis]MDM8196707.1 glycosyltransferase family 4 protein [Massilimicrobiota timonensis]